MISIFFKIYNMFLGLIRWSLQHHHAAIYIVLGLIISFLSCNVSKLKTKFDEANTKNTKLSETLNSVITTGNNKAKIVYRDPKTGEIKIVEKYLPPEGYTETKDFKDKSGKKPGFINKILGNTIGNKIGDVLTGPTIHTVNGDVKIHDRGFCLKPGFFVGYDSKIKIGLDVKLVYFQRYSLGVGSSIGSGEDFADIFISRHLDDAVPFLHPQNIELFAGYGREYQDLSKGKLLVGLRTNF